MPKFVSDILAKAGLVVDGVVTFNNTATGQTPASNDNSTKLATTAWVRNFVTPYTLPIASDIVLGGIKVGNGLSIDGTTGVLSTVGGGAITSFRSEYIITATAGQTVFTVPNGYTPNKIDLFLNGVYLNDYTYTATDSSTVVLNDGALLDDKLTIFVYSTYYVGDSPSARTTTYFTATNNQTTFTVDYVLGQVDIFYNGSKLEPEEYTANNGTSIILTTPCNAGDKIEVVNWATGGGIAYTRTLTIDGVSYDLSANRTWNILPTGGAAGDILAKNSASNYDVTWIPNYTSSVKHYVKLGQTMTIGTPVYVSGSTGQSGTNMIVSKASNTSESTSSKTIGLIATGGATNDIVFVITEGLLAGLDTSTAQANDPVWLGPNGTLIFGLLNKPVAPAHLVFIGVVTRSQQNNGEIFVKVQNGFELSELHDYVQNGVQDNYVISYEASTSLYKPKSIATLLGYTPADAARTLTINGTVYDLSANRSWSVGTVTSVSSLTIGTAGTDINSSVANSTTTPVKTLNVTDASASARGVVNTNSQTFAGDKIFSGAVAISNTSPYLPSIYSLDVNGGLLVKNTGKTASITLINADPSSGGNNAFAVWTTGGTSGTSYLDIQGYYGTSIAGSTVIKLNAAGGNVLIGSLIGTGTRMVVADANGILSTQSIVTLSSLGGVNSTTTITINGTTYDLSTNRTWTLTTSNVTEGTNLYFTTARARASISVTGSGSYDSATGVITVTGGVTSVNTLTGAVTLTTSNIGEGTNLYYTDARVGSYLTANSYATQSYVSTQISNLVASAPATLDTLNELAAALGNDPNFATTISTSLGNRLRVDIGTQNLTTTQQGYGRTNLGLGSLATLSSIGDSYITDLAYSKLTGVPSTFTPSAHTHDDRYYTETEIGSFFGGSTAITGYSKSNWDIAYGWGNHASAGYLTSVTNISGNAGTVTNGVYTNTNQTITGIKTFQQQGDDIAVILDSTNTANATRFRYKKGGTDYWSLDARGSGENDALNLYRYYNGNWYQVVSWNHSNSNATFAGTLSAANLSGTNTGDQNLSGLGGVPTTRTITINGTAYDLSADRSWTIATSDATKLPLAGGTMTGILYGTGSGTFYIYNYGRIGLPNAGKILYNNGTGSNMFFGELDTHVYGFTGNAYTDTSALAFNLNSGKVIIGGTVASGKLTIQATADGNMFSIRNNSAGYGYPNLIEAGQTGSDGYLYIRDGAGNIQTSLSGYSGTSSYFLTKVLIGTTTSIAGGPYGILTARQTTGTTPAIVTAVENSTSTVDGTILIGNLTTASSAYRLISGYSGNGSTDNFNVNQFYIRGDGYAYFKGSVNTSQYRIIPNGAVNLYNIVDADQLYAGSYTLQAGGGSAGYGGSLVMYGHSHASRPGYVSAGISSGSGGKFTVMSQGNGSGSDVFSVDASGNVGTSGLITAGGGLNINVPYVRVRWGGNTSPSLGHDIGGNDTGNSLWIEVADSDTGGLAIGNDGTTVYGAGDTGFVFRVIDEDSYQGGGGAEANTCFKVNQGAGGGGYMKGTFTATGDVVAYSDIRVKENIIPITSALSKVLELNGYYYNRTDLKDKSTKIGFIAQEVKNIVPELVTYDSLQDRYAVSYGNATALLVEAIKELKAENDELREILKRNNII